MPGSLHADRPFVFSSRRRHTILTCDWSSDVCSSDLPEQLSVAVPTPGLTDAVGFPGSVTVDTFGGATMLGSSWSRTDRKSTRLNSSHMSISYAVFCLKKKKKKSKYSTDINNEKPYAG